MRDPLQSTLDDHGIPYRELCIKNPDWLKENLKTIFTGAELTAAFEAGLKAHGDPNPQERFEEFVEGLDCDGISRKLVLNRYADELDLFPHELEELLVRTAPSKPTVKPKK